jgi:hypothetical protein
LKAELAALAAAETGLEITCCHPDTASNPARIGSPAWTIFTVWRPQKESPSLQRAR